MARNGGHIRLAAILGGVLAPALAVAQAPAEEPVRNRLAGASSPYLLAHRDQPVHWQPWDEQALALAKRLDKPIFVSIGYSACHWCHVMAKESFADPQVAAKLNEHFVCIKVDREQRPDVDEVYMAALQAMGKQGGWPLSAWLTPDGKPFFAGTYFPPQDAHGLPGFGRIVDALAKAWRERRGEVVAGADELTAHLRQELAPRAQPGEPDAAMLAAAGAAAAARFDREHGGFGGAPKFPNALELRQLLGGDDAAATMARQSLRAMARGGIHDQLAGGFHRYTVDRAWVVPHFEKMLYDNALIAQACLLAWRRDGDAELRAVAIATLAWMAQELQLPAGGFAASVDAQSDGVEGRFYVWSDADFRAALGADADAAAGWFGVTKAGNFEGGNVLTLRAGPPAGASAAAFEAAKATLRTARARRNRPAVDDKVVAAWNGLALRAFAEGFAATGDAALLASARRNAEFLLQQLVAGGRVRRVWRQGKAELAGGLDDHAAVADGLLALFEVDPEPRWLRGARAILAAAVPSFDAGDGGFWSAAKDGEQLIVQARAVGDGALPPTARCPAARR